MLENLSGLEGIVIGLTAGVIGSFLIFSTYSIMGRRAVKDRLAEFFDRYAPLKGHDYYTQKVEGLKDAGVRAKVVAETERYLGLIREEEKLLDAIIATDPSQTR
jgi:hypothetical protein